MSSSPGSSHDIPSRFGRTWVGPIPVRYGKGRLTSTQPAHQPHPHFARYRDAIAPKAINL